VIEVQNLTLRLPNFALKNISFRVGSGKCMVILGPNGAGKTTLLETIAGLYTPDEGRIIIDGQDVTDIPPERRGVGYLPQDLVLLPHLTVEENITLGLKKVDIHELEEVMAKFGISHLWGRGVEGLSMGERQKICLARALIRHPKVLLLDEPLSALDVNMRETVQRELKRLWGEAEAEGTAIIYVTHNPLEVHHIGDIVAVMEDGRIKQIGPKGEVLRNPRSKFVAEFLNMNVLEGRVVKRDRTYVEISGKRLPIARDGVKDGRVWVVIRPDGVSLAKGGLKGKVLEVIETKHATTLILDVGFTLRAEVKEIGGLKAGDEVSIKIDPESVYLLEDC